MAELEWRELERQQYWQGQMLRSRDFNDAALNSAQLRWWHNRALHNAYGILTGLQVSFTADGKLLSVEAGLAYDAFGRELYLDAPREVALPQDTSQRQALLAIYRETKSFPISTDGCLASAAHAEQPDFVWKPLHAIQPRDGILLQGLYWHGDKWELLDPPRSRARALARPHMATGSAPVGKLTLEGQAPLLQARVDTASAGFVQTPCYFAWLELKPNAPALFKLMFESSLRIESIIADAHDHFLFRVRFFNVGGMIVQGPVELYWQVHWLGVAQTLPTVQDTSESEVVHEPIG